MRVDFYQLSRDPAEKALPLLAEKALKAGQRLLVVAEDEGQLARISEALWNHSPESFLAHGRAGEGEEARQPILLSREAQPANGAQVMALADGIWRESDSPIGRILYLFDDATLQQARDCWRALGKRESLERRFWKQQGGRWVEGP